MTMLILLCPVQYNNSLFVHSRTATTHCDRHQIMVSMTKYFNKSILYDIANLHATLLTQHTFAADIEYCRLKGYTISGLRYGIPSYELVVK